MSGYCDGNCTEAQCLRGTVEQCEERADAAEESLRKASEAYDDLSTEYLGRAKAAEYALHAMKKDRDRWKAIAQATKP